MYITFSKGIARNAKVISLLKKEIIYKKFFIGSFISKNRASITGILVWKKHYEKSLQISQKFDIPLIAIEEAFVSSIKNRFGKNIEIGFAISENGGRYYKADETNIATNLLQDPTWKLNEDNLNLAKDGIKLIVENKITKYNNFETEKENFELNQNSSSILVIDQVLNDASITENGDSIETFIKMYNAALKLASGKKIYVKLHPKGKHGYLSSLIDHRKTILINKDYNIFSILEKMTDVFTVSSQVGFDALLYGVKNVHVFGKPFYSGYGLTKDYACTKIINRTVEEVFYAFYIKLCRFIIDKNNVSIINALRVVAENKRIYKQDSQTRFFIWNVPIWKRKRFFDYLHSNNIFFTNTFSFLKKMNVNSNDKIVVWGKGNRGAQDLEYFASRRNIKIVTCEDGFIRSKGLGSDFVYPSSLVFDETGIYFDCRKESDIEKMLNYQKIDPKEIERAKVLINKIIENNISKYNIDSQESVFDFNLIKRLANGRHIILITGQVSDDASIIYGSIDIDNYADLIKHIREKNPDAFIIYKPHPDVVVMNRKGQISKNILEQYVDFVAKSKNINFFFQIADSIHTLTSLSGFEALIRGKKVYTYGIPFYSGFGLTHDANISHRRVKRRTLEELAAITLIKYPRYFIFNDGLFSTPEVAIDSIKSQVITKKELFLKRRVIQFGNFIKVFYASFKAYRKSKYKFIS